MSKPKFTNEQLIAVFIKAVKKLKQCPLASEFAALLNVTDETARIYLKRLVKAKLLAVDKKLSVRKYLIK